MNPAHGYAGDLTPAQAWQKLVDGAVLVDVRTEAEWTHIGIPDTSAASRPALFIQWNLAGGTPNARFLDELNEQLGTDSPELVFLCRSGVRSVSAALAAAAAGLTAFNVLEGFEGIPDAYGDRTINGWKNRQLPWK
jgi:rhodanese-related sulfurtransferase